MGLKAEVKKHSILAHITITKYWGAKKWIRIACKTAITDLQQTSLKVRDLHPNVQTVRT